MKRLMHLNQWTYTNASMGLFNVTIFVVWGYWFNLAVGIASFGVAIWVEKQQRKIDRLNDQIKEIDKKTAMLKEARDRFDAGQPMTEEFIYFQMENLGAAFAKNVIDEETYLREMDEAMEGKLVKYGLYEIPASVPKLAD